MSYISTKVLIAVAVVEAIHNGDLLTLKRLLAENPDLAAARLGDDDLCGVLATAGNAALQSIFWRAAPI